MKKSAMVLGLLVLSALGLSSCNANGTSTGTATSNGTTSASGATTSTATTTSTGGGPGGGGSSSSASYGAVNSLTSGNQEFTGSLASTSSDQSVVLVNGSGAKGWLEACTVSKSGDTSSADNSSFYGQNATLLAKTGNLYVNGGTINSTGEGGAGIAAYSSSGIAYSKGVSITTTSNAAGGLHVCGGGINYAWNDTVTTAGEHSAAIRSDRGGGTMRVFGGNYEATGAGSPAIYCTADIQVSDASLKATGSEAFAMEGLNTTSLFNSTLEGACPSSSQNDNIQWNVICYQSMSGDSTTGTGRFNMVGGSLTADKGGMFFGTNTDAEFYIKGVSLSPSSENPFLLRATGISRWSNSYSAMSTHFTAEDQTMSGDIIHDTMSGLTVDLIGSTLWTGASTLSTSYTGAKSSTINIGAGAKWEVSGNSVIDNLYNAGTIVDASGNSVSILSSSGATLVSGTSAYTVTVSSYSATSNVSAALSGPTQDSSESFPSSYASLS